MTVSLDYDELVSEVARRRSGPFDPPARFNEGFRILLGEVERRALLTREGRRLLQHEVLRIMEQRARLDDVAPRTTSALDRSVLVITGQPRTSSTLLHNLLADLGTHCWIPLWQALEPFSTLGDEDPELRLDRAEMQLRFIDALSPDLRRLHPMKSDRPEECITLMALTGASDRFAISLTVPEYREWTQDPAVAADAYRDDGHLLDLLVDGDDRPLLLKAPSHANHIDALRSALPGAELVWLRRDDDDVEESFARLVTASRAVFQHDTDPGDWKGQWRDMDVPDRCQVVGWQRTAELVARLAAEHGVRAPTAADHADWLRPTARSSSIRRGTEQPLAPR